MEMNGVMSSLTGFEHLDEPTLQRIHFDKQLVCLFRATIAHQPGTVYACCTAKTNWNLLGWLLYLVRYFHMAQAFQSSLSSLTLHFNKCLSWSWRFFECSTLERKRDLRETSSIYVMTFCFDTDAKLFLHNHKNRMCRLTSSGWPLV